MKKLLLILLIIFIPVMAYAWNPLMVSSGSVSVPDHCTSGCTPADADSFCIDMESGVAECSFVDTDGGTSVITWNAAPVGTFCCADKGSYVLDLDVKDTEITYVEKNLGTFKTTYAAQVYFLVDSETLADTELYTVFRTYAADGVTITFYFAVKDVSGTLYLRAFLDQTTDIDVTSTKTIALDTWYRLRVYYVDEDAFVVNFSDCNGANNELVVNAGVDDVGTSNSVQYITFGSHAAATGDIKFQIDNAKGDDDTAISTGCTE